MSRAEHAPQVEELPDIIPEELYVKELDSAEERALFEQLKSSHPADVDSDSFPTSGVRRGFMPGAACCMRCPCVLLVTDGVTLAYGDAQAGR